jgi:hypothetical protein
MAEQVVLVKDEVVRFDRGREVFWGPLLGRVGHLSLREHIVPDAGKFDLETLVRAHELALLVKIVKLCFHVAVPLACPASQI